MNSQIKERFDGNIARVRHLVTIYEQSGGSGRGRRAVDISDVLRAAVVLLHAAVEDLLRSLERRVLPRAPSDVLDTVPLVGLPARSRFELGALAVYRGKSVDELIDASVAAHLESATYNNANELSAVIRRLGADPSAFRQWFSSLEAMMKRRHHIVHQADRDRTSGSGHHRAKSLSKGQVTEWVDIAAQFAAKVFQEVPDTSGPAP